MTYECGERVAVRIPLFDVDINPVEPGETGRVVGHTGQFEIVTLDRGEDYLGDRRAIHAPATALRPIRPVRRSK